MLKKLKTVGVGALPEGELTFGRKFNVFTGDNGLGKTFVLDLVWYALTRRWPHEVNPTLSCGYMALPATGAAKPMIQFDLDTIGRKALKNYQVRFDFERQAWVGRPGRPYSSGLVIYAQADGGFCVWDPAKNYWVKRGGIDLQEREPAFVFTPREVWEGQYKFADSVGGSTKTKCVLQGLLLDWVLWQRNPNSPEFPVLKKLLSRLSPPEFPILVGDPKKVSLDDVREIPTVKLPYGEVPALWGSSAIRRILSLAYILVWSFSEHVKAAELLRMTPTSQITLLFDELDAHLHPKWQRTVMGALMHAVEEMIRAFVRKRNVRCNVQIMASTHSPLVMAALEDEFDPATDKWFDFDFGDEGRVIQITDRPFVRQGQSDEWLKSQAFDLLSTRSPGVERTLLDAARILGRYTDGEAQVGVSRKPPQEVRSAFEELQRRLPATDAFLLRFRAICEMYGWELS